MSFSEADYLAAQPRIMAFCRYTIRDICAADDLAQTTALKMWSARAGFEGDLESLISWGCKIAQNAARTGWRKNKPEVEDPDGEIADGIAGPDDPERRLDLWDAVRRLNKLSTKRRTALTMFVIGGDYEAIRKKNGYNSYVTAKTAVHRAKADLAAEMDRPMLSGRVRAECMQCGSVLIDKRSRQRKFCSLRCVGRAKRTRQPRACLACRESFAAKPSEIREGKAKFCSSLCASSVRRGKQIDRNCVGCGAAFTVRKPSNPKTFCSKRCGNLVRWRIRKIACEPLDGITIWTRTFEALDEPNDRREA